LRLSKIEDSVKGQQNDGFDCRCAATTKLPRNAADGLFTKPSRSIEGGMCMNVGDRVKFQFGGKEKEGVVVRVFPKTIYLKVDFPHHPGKVVVRKLAELEGKVLPKKKKAKKAKAQKEKAQKAKAEEKKEEKEEKKEE